MAGPMTPQTPYDPCAPKSYRLEIQTSRLFQITSLSFKVSAKFNFRVATLFKEIMKAIDYIDYGGHKPSAAQVMQNALRRNGKCVIL
jgi:hypothetical protein